LLGSAVRWPPLATAPPAPPSMGSSGRRAVDRSDRCLWHHPAPRRRPRRRHRDRRTRRSTGDHSRAGPPGPRALPPRVGVATPPPTNDALGGKIVRSGQRLLALSEVGRGRRPAGQRRAVDHAIRLFGSLGCQALVPRRSASRHPAARADCPATTASWAEGRRTTAG
jgi:hypothetical protein